MTPEKTCAKAAVLFFVFLILGVASWPLGCDRGSGSSGGRPAEITAALKTAHQASVNAAEVTECALTATARSSSERKRILWLVDAAETATRAATRALAAAVKLDETCRDRWDTACDHQVGIVTVMTSSTQETREMACAKLPDPDGGVDAGAGAGAKKK